MACKVARRIGRSCSKAGRGCKASRQWLMHASASFLPPASVNHGESGDAGHAQSRGPPRLARMPATDAGLRARRRWPMRAAASACAMLRVSGANNASSASAACNASATCTTSASEPCPSASSRAQCGRRGDCGPVCRRQRHGRAHRHGLQWRRWYARTGDRVRLRSRPARGEPIRPPTRLCLP